MKITYDKYSLIIDDKRVFIKSGAFHYFRTPGAELARDRFQKMKSGGYNTVDLYFNWNYHSQKQGEYDFTGIKNVRNILQIAKDTGLYVIARPGPFINAEVNAGGLPFWLLKENDVVPRNRIGTEYRYSPKYMKYVREWYDNIIPIIREFDNVILFQIENEYATDTMEEEYLRELYEMARERGIKCPIFHNDAYFAGLWGNCVDIYALDLYPYINPNQNWKQDNFCFDTLDNIEDVFRSSKENSPPFIAEMQSGWFDKWDGSGYAHIRNALGDEHINIMTKTALSQGVTLFNHYLTAGGTNWGDLACDEVYTSYEFASPIDEFGVLQSNYFKAKAINYFIDSFDFTCTEPKNFDFYQENIYTKMRHDINNNCDWLFVRNMNGVQRDIQIFEDKIITLKPYDMKICPINLSLKGCDVDFSDCEFFARIKNETEETVFLISDKNAHIYIKDFGEISGNKKDYENITFERENGKTQFVFLTKELADRSWYLKDKMIFNADYVLPNGAVAVEKNTEIGYFDLKYKFGKKNCIVTEVKNDEQPEDLKIASVEFCSPEIDTDYDYSNWETVKEKTDSLSCGLYDEFVWYKSKIPDNLTEITLSARHLFALYINGKEVLNRNSYKLEKLQEVPETISIPLNKTILSKSENELTILVQNLGFDKGFSGDTNNPRGLVTFETVPSIPIEFKICEKLSCQRDNKKSDNPYLTKLTANFDIEFKDNVFFAKYISFENFKCRRATIFLNGVKIGRYIKRRHVQEKFYLINQFLKPHNTLEIVIWEKERNIKSPLGFKSDMKNVKIKIGTYKTYQLFK